MFTAEVKNIKNKKENQIFEYKLSFNLPFKKSWTNIINIINDKKSPYVILKLDPEKLKSVKKTDNNIKIIFKIWFFFNLYFYLAFNALIK